LTKILLSKIGKKISSTFNKRCGEYYCKTNKDRREAGMKDSN
jgi:hypothetical protein